MYEEQKTKRSSTLPPDPNSLKNDILRKHHQTYTWLRCLEPIVETLPLDEFGWKVDNEVVVPVWYTCPQLPSGESKKRKRDDHELAVDRLTQPKSKRTNIQTMPADVHSSTMDMGDGDI